jgi:hypothetical protein
MSQDLRARRTAEWLIHAACRRLPADMRGERYQEWAAELPAILDDQSIHPSFRRSLRALTFSIGISRTTTQLSRSARADARRTRNSQWRTGAMDTRAADVALRAFAGAACWLVISFGVIALLRQHPDPRGWLFLLVVALAVAFDAFCLVDIARAERVRYLPKWAWALICLIQAPGGGIAYLSLGRISRPRPAPPGEASP